MEGRRIMKVVMDSQLKVFLVISSAIVAGVILIPPAFALDTIILVNEDGGAPESCIGGALILAQNLTDLCDVIVLTPLDNQILEYNGTYWINVNATSGDDTLCANVGTGAQVFKNGECNFRTILGSSDISVVENANEIVIDFNGTGAESTICNNVGVGTGLICRGGNVDIKSLIAGANIAITNNVDDISIAVTGISSDNTVCANVGTGSEVFKDGECNFRTILGSPDISVTQQANTITIDFNGTGGSESTVCNNVGVGTGLICRGGNVDIKSLIAGTSIGISNNADDITITNSAPDNTVCTSVGTGFPVYSGGECQFDSLIGGTGITITDTTDDLTIDNSDPEDTACNNVGTGIQLCSGGNVNLDTLLAGVGITITDTTDDWTITNTLPESTVCTNSGAGTGLCDGGNINIKSLASSTGIGITSDADNVFISSFCTNTGTGEAICESANNINSLIASDGITVTDTTGDLTLTSTCENTGTGEAVCEANNNINSLIAGTGITITDTTGDLTISSTPEIRYFTKPTDETVNNSAVLQNDDDLSFSVSANSVYIMKFYARYELLPTSDFKYTFTAPVGTTIRGIVAYAWTSNPTTDDVDLTATRTHLVTATRLETMAHDAMIYTGANAGTIQYQWAQNTATAEDTVVGKGSTMIITKII